MEIGYVSSYFPISCGSCCIRLGKVAILLLDYLC